MSTPPLDSPNPASSSPNEHALLSDLDLLDVLIVLARHKWSVLGLPVIAGVLTAVIVFLMPNIYTATARILPPQQDQSTAVALLGQLANIGTGSAGSLFGLKNPSDLYVGMLKSRTVADRVIERFKLKDRYREDTLIDTRKVLEDVTRISTGKDAIITIEVDDEDPTKAAEIANAYVAELDRLNDSLAINQASQRRLFFAKQLEQTKNALASAEVSLKQTQERTGLIKLDEQGRAIIDAVAQVQAQVAAKEVQLEAMKSFATELNPELVRARKELAGLRQQLRRVQRENAAGNGEVLIASDRVPEVGLEYVRKLREVKYYESLFELVAKQYELARLDEAKDASVIQVVDRAIAPDKKSKPKRTLTVLLAALIASVISIVLAFVIEAHDTRRNPALKPRLLALKEHLKLTQVVGNDRLAR